MEVVIGPKVEVGKELGHSELTLSSNLDDSLAGE
jgi:hypothetical protein